ncbi:NAD(P)H-binding protein [Companilactobacillus halodurans]|uniref:Short-chain dehydrogenase n=1 Tax=Companilactobacillus halodurans TaxID=2584183 RepID=A0A5P0ZMM4_9LACO|nr:short-chain dehydrogenase [Companilactobacillus halodurans]MQS97764.1 short-chain dehydrogenase [Companilactobacillus halodurans]
MTNVLILGAYGKIARIVEQNLLNNPNYQLTLFLRNASRLNMKTATNVKVVEGDVANKALLEKYMSGQDVVYANLNGQMERWARNIVQAMDASQVKQLIWITGSGLYHEVPAPFGSWVENYVGHESKEDTRRGAKVIETSDLNYTIIRAAYMINADEVDYELTKKGETFKGTMISRKSIADFVVKIIDHPEEYIHGSYGISKPGTDDKLPEIRMMEHDL